jgi:hypothetical protein
MRQGPPGLPDDPAQDSDFARIQVGPAKNPAKIGQDMLSLSAFHEPNERQKLLEFIIESFPLICVGDFPSRPR